MSESNNTQLNENYIFYLSMYRQCTQVSFGSVCTDVKHFIFNAILLFLSKSPSFLNSNKTHEAKKSLFWSILNVHRTLKTEFGCLNKLFTEKIKEVSLTL